MSSATLGSAAIIKDATTAKSRKREWWRRGIRPFRL